MSCELRIVNNVIDWLQEFTEEFEAVMDFTLKKDQKPVTKSKNLQRIVVYRSN